MEVVHACCAGLDVHGDAVVAGVGIADGGPAKTGVRTFDTTTPGLLALSAWLAEAGCTHAALQAAGLPWRPVWHVLSDGEVTLILANAAHVRNVPGRKADVADAVWLADLLTHGLIRPSCVPGAATQDWQPKAVGPARLHTRKQLMCEQASHVQRARPGAERRESLARADQGGAGWARRQPAPVPAAAAPAADRRARRRPGRHRRRGGPQPRAFPPGGRVAALHPRRG